MPTFVIDTLTYAAQAAKLASQLEEHKKNDITKQISNFSLDTIIKEIQEFNLKVAKQVEDQLSAMKNAEGKVIDQLGNEFLGHFAYRYYEITWNRKDLFERIRYLGPSPLGANRFIIEGEGIVNPFSYVTVLNLVGDIREINKSPLQLNIEELFKCKRDAWKKDSEILSGKTLPPYRYSWDYLEKNYFSPRAKYIKNGTMSEAELNKIIKENEQKSIKKKEELEQNLITIEANKKDIADKAEKQIEKSETPLDWWTRNYKASFENFTGSVEKSGEEAGKVIAKFVDKFSIGCIIEEAIKCVIPQNVSCKRLFENLPAGQFMERLKLVFPEGDATFRQIETVIEKEIFGSDFYNAKKDLQNNKRWIRDDTVLLEDIKKQIAENPNDQKLVEQKDRLEQKIEEYRVAVENSEKIIEEKTAELAPDLKLSQRQQEEILRGGGNIAAIFSLPTEDESIGPQALTVKIMAAIDTIIPLEDICEAIVNAISFGGAFPFVNFDGLPPFEFPKPKPIKDILGGFGLQLNEIFVRLLTESLIALIDGFLRELINCDVLDQFIAGLINGNFEGQQFEDLENLFSQDRIQSIVDRNYDRFVDNISSRASSIFTAGTNNEIKIGLSQQASRAILEGEQLEPGDFIGADIPPPKLFEAAEAQATYDIDITGTKFETIFGTKVFDTSQLDQFFANLKAEERTLLQENGKYTSKAVADALGIDIKLKEEASVTGEITLSSDEKENLKQEVNCIMRHITSVLMPSQVLDLLAGRASEKTKQMAFEIIQVSCETPIVDGLFQNPNSFADMFKVFGIASGLDKLKGEVEVLADSPQIRNAIPTQKCGPYENIDSFREDLLSKTIDKEQAKQIIENLNNERINRYNELSNRVVDLANGNPSTEQKSDPSEVLLQSLKDAFEGNPIQQNPVDPNKSTSQDSEGSIQEIIQREIDRASSQSPIIQDMFAIVKDSFLLPVQQVFDEDIKSLSDAMGDIVEVDEPIERLISVDTPDGRTVEVVNPEFKRMIDVGLIPVVESPSDEYARMVDKKNVNIFNLKESISEVPAIGGEIAGFVPDLSFMLDNNNGMPVGYKAELPTYYISGDSNADFVKKGFNGVELKPIQKKVNKKVIGNDLKRSSQNIEVVSVVNNEELIIKVLGQSISLENEKIEQTGLAGQVSLPEDPSWSIQFEESKNYYNRLQNIYELKTDGSYITSINGLENFYITDFSYTKDMVSENDISRFLSLRYNTASPKSRKYIFDDIIFENLQPLIFDRENERLKQEFENSSTPLYDSIVRGFVKTVSEDISESDLLKPVSPIGGELTKLETLNFVKDCEHIMDFEGLSEEFDIIYAKFSNLPEKIPTFQQLTGLAKRESPLADTTKIVLSKILIKTLAIDIILKALPAFDYYMYSEDIVNNEMMNVLACTFVESELTRLRMNDFVHENLENYYKVFKSEEVSLQKRINFSDKRLRYPLEIELSVKEEFPKILKQVKKVVGKDDNSFSSPSDFLRLFLESLPILDVHNYIGTEEGQRDAILQNSIVKDGGIALQRYIFLPKLNRNSKHIKNNPEYFTDEKIKEIEAYGVVNFELAVDIIKEIENAVGETFDLYVCEGDTGYTDRLFDEPYQVGLRIVNVIKKSNNDSSININGIEYPYLLPNCQYLKSGYINEKGLISYDLLTIADERYSVNQKDISEDFVKRNNSNRYMFEFFGRLQKRLLDDEEVNLMFTYAIPLKEIAAILIEHIKLANNTKKMKYLFEPTKKAAQRMADFLDNIGNDTLSSERIREAMKKVQREKDNVGNPAGPLDFSALKMFTRTPIHILKGVAIASDPNIALTDKIISGISLVSALASSIPPIEGVPPPPKIPIPPYSLISLALLPFPLFTPPPAGIIPPLTSYNVGSPIGPIFLALEPLLWDLPFYKEQNNQTLFGNTPECKDNEEQN